MPKALELCLVAAMGWAVVGCSSNDFAVMGAGDETGVDTSVNDGVGGDTVADAEDTGAEGGTDGGTAFTCIGKPDGTLCGDGSVRRICRKLACVVSKCGDSFVDSGAGEECDDGNGTPRDGCEPITCKFSCKAPSDCDDKNECTVGETCSTTTHACVAGTAAPKGSPCKLDGGAPGSCNGVLCAKAGCGNKIVEATLGEECDDGNLDDTDGCRSDCKYTCHNDAECDDKNACTGTEKCDLSKHTCSKGTPLVCDDKNPCTDDKCDVTKGCVSTVIDMDGDGFAPSSTGCGKDCNDGDPAINPKAAEACNGIDDNCDGTIDEGITTTTCYYDKDGDGYGDDSTAFKACVCPTGATEKTGDCDDADKNVNPSQTAFFTSKSGVVGFDYDCSGKEELQYPDFGVCADPPSGSGPCTYKPGWATITSLDGGPGTSIPGCGGKGTFLSGCTGGGGLGKCTPALTPDKPQGCH